MKNTDKDKVKALAAEATRLKAAADAAANRLAVAVQNCRAARIELANVGIYLSELDIPIYWSRARTYDQDTHVADFHRTNDAMEESIARAKQTTRGTEESWTAWRKAHAYKRHIDISDHFKRLNKRVDEAKAKNAEALAAWNAVNSELDSLVPPPNEERDFGNQLQLGNLLAKIAS